MTMRPVGFCLKYTHVMKSDEISSTPYFVHRAMFDEFIEDLVKVAGEEYRHALNDRDSTGSPIYEPIVNVFSIAPGDVVRLPYDAYGEQDPLHMHYWVRQGFSDEITYLKPVWPSEEDTND